IESDTIDFDDGHKSAVGRFWVPAFSQCKDLHFVVNYNGQGTLKIKNCKVSEFRRYRLIRLAGILIFFGLLDVFYLIFFTDSIIKVNKIFIGISLIILAASIPFINDTLFNGHDIAFHLKRIVAISEGLSEGQFPVRISTTLNNGFGYVNSLYYCDIFLYASALLYKFHVPLRICYQFYVILINIVTGIFTYYTMSKFTKRNALKILGTMLYMLCSYRLVNLNLRSALGEYTAMCFLPLIVVGLRNILTKEEIRISDWFPLAAGMSGIIMSHIVTAEMVVINIALLCIMCIFRILNIKKIKAMLKAVFASILMTAWFLIPLLDSLKNQTTIVQKSDLRMLGATTRPLSILFGLFTSGHDFHSTKWDYINLGLPFVLGIFLLLYCLYSYKQTKIHNQKPKDFILEFRMLCLFIFINIFLTCKLFPWDTIQNLLGIDTIGQQLGTIQFAWRFLSIAAILLSIAIVIALNHIREINKTIYKSSVKTLMASVILCSGFFYYSFNEWGVEAKWSNIHTYSGSDDLYLLDGTNINVRNISKCRVIKGNVRIKKYKKVKGKATLYVQNKSQKMNAKITVPIFAYNHYQVNALKDSSLGKELPISKDVNNCILITIPSGYEGDLMIRFVEPTSWRISELISLITWLFILYKLIVKVKRSQDESHLIDATTK
ncbi:hypothetical protein, partial [Kandleria vitulina]|uniref:hypothetical protein n=1 Tax=Kandleria vitulina TaxID=1630 RepID=UPI003328D201